MKIRKILVPTDFSEDAESAVNAAKGLASDVGAEIILLHAYRVDLPLATPSLGGGYALPPGFYEELRAQAVTHVEKIASEVTAAGVKTTGIAVEERAVVAILEEAKRHSVDLIVMGTRGLTGLKHLAFGSVAERVIREASCPVLTVKAEY
jgi:nucleotide-binding universal stress UspA family protein